MVEWLVRIRIFHQNRISSSLICSNWWNCFKPQIPLKETEGGNQIQVPDLMQNSFMEPVDVLVIGAGLAGLAAARDLHNSERSVLILEKSRGVGGRAATKRLDLNQEGIVRADHGAQFFTARSERFQTLISQLSDLGMVREWTRGFPKLGPNGLEQRDPGNPRFVCPPGMNSLAKSIRDGLDNETPIHVEYAVTVVDIKRTGHGWTAILENGEVRHGRTLLVNAPAPQIQKLLDSHLSQDRLEALSAVHFDPCWAAIAALKTRPEPEWKGLEIDHPMLAWAALDHTKRDPDAPPVLVLHATSAWSFEHLEQSPETTLPLLLKAAQSLLGDWVGNRLGAIAHRWRYALPTVTFPGPFLAQGNIVACGDWCAPSGGSTARGTPRIETALESGWASAKYLNDIFEGTPT
jgi:renalase